MNNKELLNMAIHLSKKSTTELALQLMELSSENLILEQQCNMQKEVIDKVRQCIKDFLCSEEYINVNGNAIANNYENILHILESR